MSNSSDALIDECAEEVEAIGNWMRNEAPFNGRTDPNFIKLFLHNCDYDEQRAIKCITKYYEIRKLHPNLMKNRDFYDVNVMKLFNRGVYLDHFYTELLNYWKSHSMNVFRSVVSSDVYIEERNYSPIIVATLAKLQSGRELEDVFRLLVIGLESSILESRRLRKYGGIGVIDCAGMSWTIAMHLTPSFVTAALSCLLEANRKAVRELHFINAGTLIMAAYNVCSAFLADNIRNMLHFHKGSFDSIRHVAPPESLCVEHGGTNGTVAQSIEALRTIAVKWRSHLLDDEKYGYPDN